MGSSVVAFRTTTTALHRRRSVAVKAEMLNSYVIISLSTGLSLFFNFQRENIAKRPKSIIKSRTNQRLPPCFPIAGVTADQTTVFLSHHQLRLPP
ncbi:hypothetical protein LINGRAHAP2_LOCUS18201 [Linum grandiflorum]